MYPSLTTTPTHAHIYILYTLLTISYSHIYTILTISYSHIYTLLTISYSHIYTLLTISYAHIYTLYIMHGYMSVNHDNNMFLNQVIFK